MATDDVPKGVREEITRRLDEELTKYPRTVPGYFAFYHQMIDHWRQTGEIPTAAHVLRRYAELRH